ncbi:uncharacterized protein LOC131207336 [Anopheles bellator]|uniref:uncharacterized protein LOC131207336 n=1 Tax=Anopheles bellator TaxID=139047 RepID=UPI002648AAEB|nr:uncharacterized protein LOC131207336 [Anopheles bellator]
MTPIKAQRPVTRHSAKKETAVNGATSVSEAKSDSSTEELVIDVNTSNDSTNQNNARAETSSGSIAKETTSTKKSPAKRPIRKRRRISLPFDQDDQGFTQTFEDSIRSSAAKNNLSPMCVKKLLKKLVMNDHVFAIVRLKEEEEQSRKAAPEVQKNDDNTESVEKAELTEKSECEDDDDDDEEKEQLQPKLTRLKARQLNKKLLPVAPLNAPPPDVAALIREDLNSDDDDDEYRPGEDDVVSDDDTNTTFSDAESQPRTPASIVVGAANDPEMEQPCTMDGPFKVPKPRCDSQSQSEQEQENIALRTRSKFCLTTTAIETLESTFMPPDITTDMYDHDCDMDQEWRVFLEEFTKPLPNDLDDDDDNDPEYVAADKIPLDAEEMRQVKVSKKELNELVNELVQMTSLDDESFLDLALNDTINESLTCPRIDRSELLTTPLPPSIIEQENTSTPLPSTQDSLLPAQSLVDYVDRTVEKRYFFREETVPIDIQFTEDQIGLTDFQFQLLHQQLRVHVQLTATHFLQTYGHPQMWKLAKTFKGILNELHDIGKQKPNMMPSNLPLAVECCQSWEDELAIDNSSNKELIDFWHNEIRRNRNPHKTGDFHWRVMEKIVNCEAFLYAAYLPYKPFRPKLKPFNYNSPVTFFLQNGYAPPFKHVLEVFDLNNIIPIALYQKGIIHYNWDRYLYSDERKIFGFTLSGVSKLAKYLLLKGRKTPKSVAQPVPAHQVPVNSEPAAAEQFKISVLLPNDVATALNVDEVSYTIPVLEESAEICEETPEIVLNTGTENVMRNEAATVTVSTQPEPCEPTNLAYLTEYNDTDCSDYSEFVTDVPVGSSDESLETVRTSTTIRPQHRPVKPVLNNIQSNVSRSRTVANAILYSVLNRNVQQLKSECTARSLSNASGPIRQVHTHFWLLEVYSRFLDDLRKMSDSLTAYRHRYRALQQFRTTQQDGLWQFSYNPIAGSLVVSARRVTRPVPGYCSMDEKDATFAFNYFEKVEETLLAAGRLDLFERFEELIKNFNENEHRPTLLYRQIEDLLSVSHPELVDMFLTFLLPAQAVEVGRFMEHFILTNMSDFLEKLNLFFAKQPSQVKKIYACLNELSNEPNVTMEQVKLRILPLLKGSTLLSEWFLQLFPTEPPPEVPLCDYETITMKKNPLMENCDDGLVYEQVPYVETGPEGHEQSGGPNSIRYIQGRIIQGALPVRLSFLASNCVVKVGPKDGEGSTELKLCDDATLRAHAIRLNPLLHSTKVTSLGSGVVHAPVEDSTDANGTWPQHRDVPSYSFEDVPRGDTSPQKASPKQLPIKKRFVSSNPRQSGGSEKTPPSTAQSKKLVNSTVAPDSRALATGKKLKTLIGAPQPLAEKVHIGEDAVKIKVRPFDGQPLGSSTANPPVGRELATVSVNGNDRFHQQPNIADSHVPSKPVPDVTRWTREEDKIILEEMKNGYSSVAPLVQRIKQKLVERTNEQIRNRFEFLLEVLRKVNQR